MNKPYQNRCACVSYKKRVSLVNFVAFARVGLLTLIMLISSAFAQAPEVTRQDLATRLGWVSDPASPNCCSGYFYDPLATVTLPPLEGTPVKVQADGGTFEQHGSSTLNGNILISQPGREIKAGVAHLNRDPVKGDNVSVDLEGQVTVHEPGKIIIGNIGYVDLQTKLVRMRDAYYRIAFGQKLNSNRLYDTVAWGQARSIEKREDDIIELKKASYTTCSPIKPTWMLHAGDIVLDRDEGRGVAKNVVIDIHDFPMFYLPYFSFPLDKRRKSGFLFPTFGTSNQQGLSFFVPFYWNIAPNFDDTITPAAYGHRGIQLNNDFRYMTRNSQGDFYFAVLPNDAVFQSFKQTSPELYSNTPSSPWLPDLEKSSNNRVGLYWRHQTHFNENWMGSVDYSYVSDDYYLQNFTLPGSVTPNQLLQQGVVSYQDPVWNFKGLLQNYLTLHPVNETPVQNQYSRMPELDLSAKVPIEKSNLNFGWDSQYVHFNQLTMANATLPPPKGDRLNLQPSFVLPLHAMWGYFVPKVQYQFTQYVITGLVQAEGTVYQPNTLNRELPIIDIDTGLFFEKHATFKNTNYTQTLEPRLFYLYVPYKNQDKIPEFDTSLPPFGYNQLFLTNRFSGLDRVGDANQVSIGVTSRLLNKDSDQEKAAISVGEIFYFANRKVTLCTTPGCSDIDSSPGATPATAMFSPIVGQATLNLIAAWNLNGSVAWDPALGKTNNASIGVGYRGANNRVLNLGYNFLTQGDVVQTNPPTSTSSEVNNLNQAAVSATWPVWDRWRLFGGMTYNISHVHAQNYLYGAEYDSCCWAMRIVGGRVFQSLNENNNPVFNNTVFLQWQLKGLGNFGSSDPAQFLTGNIPGYNDSFGKAMQ